MIFRPASHPFYFACRKVGADPQLQPETLARTERSNVQGRYLIRMVPQRRTDIQIEEFCDYIRSPDDITIYLQHQRHQHCYM